MSGSENRTRSSSHCRRPCSHGRDYISGRSAFDRCSRFAGMRRVKHQERMTLRIPTITVVCLLALQSEAMGQSAGSTTPGSCAALKQLQVPGVALTVTKTEWIAAGTTPPTGPGAAPSATTLPAYCRLDGVIDRRAGAAGATYGIGFALALPENW